MTMLVTWKACVTRHKRLCSTCTFQRGTLPKRALARSLRVELGLFFHRGWEFVERINSWTSTNIACALFRSGRDACFGSTRVKALHKSCTQTNEQSMRHETNGQIVGGNSCNTHRANTAKNFPNTNVNDKHRHSCTLIYTIPILWPAETGSCSIIAGHITKGNKTVKVKKFGNIVPKTKILQKIFAKKLHFAQQFWWA